MAGRINSAVERVLIYFKVMARLASATAIIAIALWEILAQARPLAICDWLVRLKDVDLDGYVKQGLYSKGLQLIRKGEGRRGVREVKRQWEKVSQEISSAFQRGECARIKEIMDKYVFREKPLAEVGLDRFAMPKSVRREVARAMCLQSDLEDAGKMLVVSGDVEDIFIGALLLGAGGNSETCVAILSGITGRCEKPVLERICKGDFGQQSLSCFEGTEMETVARRLSEPNKEEEER
jgi:hypothetical protein